MVNISPASVPIKRKTIISNIVFLFSGTTLSQGLTAFALLLTARQLGPDSYGQYTASLVLTSIFSIFYNLGLNIWFMHESNRKPEKLNILLGTTLAIKLAIGLVWLLTIFIITAFYSSGVFPRELLRLAALVSFLDNMFLTLLAVFKASLRNHLTSIFLTISDLTWVILTINLIQQGNNQVGAYLRIRAWVMLGSFLIASMFVIPRYKPRIQLVAIKQAFGGTLAFAVSEFLSMTAMRVDVLIVALLLGKAATGLYSPAISLVNALFMPINAISIVFLPVLSNLFANDISQAWKTAKRSLWLHAGAGAFLTTVIVIGARYFITFLGASFAGSLEILYILSSIIFIHALIFALINILIATGSQGKRALIQLISVILNIILNFTVVKLYGIRGVAYVYLFTEIFLLAILAGLTIRTNIRGVALHA